MPRVDPTAMRYRLLLLKGTTMRAALLEHGADVNAQGGPYGNALQAACSKGHDNIVQILLEHGADVHIQSEDGLFVTALQAARSQGHDEIVQMIQLHSVAQSVSHRHPCKRSKTS